MNKKKILEIGTGFKLSSIKCNKCKKNFYTSIPEEHIGNVHGGIILDGKYVRCSGSLYRDE